MTRWILALVAFAFVGKLFASGDGHGPVKRALLVEKSLIVLYADGHIGAWDLGTRKLQPALAVDLQGQHVSGIDSFAGKLYVYRDTEIEEFDLSVGKMVERIPAVADSSPLNFFHAQDGFFSIASEYAMNLSTGVKSPLPNLGGQTRKPFLRPLCFAKTDHGIWVGSGYGEWGGNLVCFNTEKGEWHWFSDSLHYATGIAIDGGRPILVSWSMSHMMAWTMFRTHDANAKVEREYPQIDGRYYQTAHFNAFSKRLFAVEQNTLGTVNEAGDFKAVLELPKTRYLPERKAVGVDPGVAEILSVDADSEVIVYHTATPIMVRGRKILEFEETDPVEKSTNKSE